MADELDRALRQRDLALMAEPRSRGVAPRKPGPLDMPGGIAERLAFLNQTFNPVEGIGQSMRAGERLFSQDADYLQRIEALGSMMSGVAGIAAPIAAARAIGVPAASAMMEGLLGGSPTTQAAGDMARQFATDESGAFRLYQGSPHNFNAERLVRYPDGRTEYIVGRPDVLPDVPAGAEVLQDFPLGRQRMDKIGTGEGAQAYGYGLYGAEAEGIARGYRDALSSGRRGVDPPRFVAFGGPLKNVDSDTAHDIAEGGMPVLERRIAQVQSVIGNKQMHDEHVAMFGADDAERALDPWRRELDELQRLREIGDFSTIKGKMYELNINANPEDFLDWDKPLSEQPAKVRDALAKVDIRAGNMTAKDRSETISAALSGDPRLAHLLRDRTINATGDTIYKGMSDSLGAMDWPIGADAATRKEFYGRGAVNATSALREAGIPGIRYLDAGSRSAGDGSRNYVIFDENLIEIVRKYGIAGAAAMLGVSAVDVEEAIAQGAPPSQWDQLVVGPQ